MENLIAHSSDEPRKHLFKLLVDFALERREVILASGQTSDIYLDCRQVYFRGEAHFLIGELFYQKMLEIEKKFLGFSACGGMAMGSIPLSLALSAAAFRRGRELPGFAVRKDSKDHGMKSIIEGNKCLAPGSQILIVEDVVTTGGSALKAIQELRNVGVNVSHMLAIVDREQGGAQNLLENGVKLEALFSLKDFLGA
jgi:orotate phosphoribosyltransferase